MKIDLRPFKDFKDLRGHPDLTVGFHMYRQSSYFYGGFFIFF